MGKVKKTFNLGGISVTLEIDEPQNAWTPSVPQRVATPQRASVPTPPMGEPDGFDAHIDRPLRENYRGDYFLAQRAFENDLAKYRKAESAVKQCNWPTREPMGNGVPKWPVPQQSAPHSGTLVECGCSSQRVPQPAVVTRDAWGRFASKSTTPCVCRATRSQQRDVRQKWGRVPVGAVVAGHTWDGEPIFNC